MNSILPHPAKKKWVKRILLFSCFPLAIALVYCGLYTYVMIMHGPLGNAKVIYTDTSCGNAEYRIVVHQYDNGDGYLELTNREGKIFDLSRYTRGVDYTPFDWDANCKRVMVGSNDGLVFLKAK